MTDKELCTIAITAMSNSYSPYSNYKVGAALLCKNGDVYAGCNIENASFSPTVCAERVAIFKAISEGNKEFCKIAVVGSKDGVIQNSFPPCGVCRQVLLEFCDPDFEILLIKDNKQFETVKLEMLIPYSFSPNNLK